jgi:peptide/nickel transport system substrate-binding protein
MAADHIRLVFNPFYNGKRPYLSSLELHFYPDFYRMFTAYNQGELDGISYILPQDFPTVAARQDLQIFSSDQSEYLIVILNLRNANLPFFQDPALRHALLYALNRQRLIESAAAGQGIVAHSPFMPENWAYNPNVRQYPYSFDQANQLLTQAGWVDSDGDKVRDKAGKNLEFQLVTNDDPLRVALARQIVEDWSALGIRVVVAPVSFPGLVNDFLAPRRFDAALIGWEIEGDPDPYSLWHSSRIQGSGTNYAGWANKEADELMERARSILDEGERKAAYDRFQEIFAAETPSLLLYYPVYTYGVSDRIKNVQIDSLTRPSERFATFNDWYVITRRVPANQVPADAPPTPPG